MNIGYNMKEVSTDKLRYHFQMPKQVGTQSSTATTTRRGDQAMEIVEALRADIIAGALPAGGELRQQQLAARFGVSRMPVREALRCLEAEGLIALAPNKGATVAPLSVADLREIYEMRIAAEALALRLALPELTNAQIDRAAAVQSAMEAAPIAEFGASNARFHAALYLPCARPRLLSHIEVLSNAADRYLRITIASLDYAEKSHREHHALLDACTRRNEADVVRLLTSHIEEAGDALAKLLADQRMTL